MIDLNDLRHSINRALNLGRYTVRVAVVNGEQVPSSIDLDLLERDDDGFAEFSDELARREHLAPLTQTESERILARVNTALDAEDDHGPNVPFQGTLHREAIESGTETDASGQKWKTFDLGPRVYEFALQDFHEHKRRLFGDVFEPVTIDQVDIVNAEGMNEAATKSADWVHVFDRVTRERRTLKRPEPDAVLTGLRDVAADLRRKFKSGDRVLNNGPNSNGDTGVVISNPAPGLVRVIFSKALGAADVSESSLDLVDTPDPSSDT